MVMVVISTNEDTTTHARDSTPAQQQHQDPETPSIFLPRHMDSSLKTQKQLANHTPSQPTRVSSEWHRFKRPGTHLKVRID
jgi:hypothetical protein